MSVLSFPYPYDLFRISFISNLYTSEQGIQLLTATHDFYLLSGQTMREIAHTDLRLSKSPKRENDFVHRADDSRREKMKTTHLLPAQVPHNGFVSRLSKSRGGDFSFHRTLFLVSAPI